MQLRNVEEEERVTFLLWLLSHLNRAKYNLCSHIQQIYSSKSGSLKQCQGLCTRYYANRDFTRIKKKKVKHILETKYSTCQSVLKMFLRCYLRPGRLPAAVHQDLWEGESRWGPAATDHPPGAGGLGGVQNRPPGAHTGSCGFTLCTGKSRSTQYFVQLQNEVHTEHI